MTEEEEGDRSIFADLLPDEKTRKTREATQEYFAYLDDLRERGEANMFGAVPYLMAEFDLSRGESREVLSAWMKTFRSESEGGPSSPSDDIVVVIDKDKTDAV